MRVSHCMMSVFLSLGALPGWPGIIVNEVDSNQPSQDNAEFIELYDGGAGETPLDGITLVLFNGDTDSAYLVMPLDGRKTGDDGLFVVGNPGLVPPADLALAAGSLQNGPDAVALYDTTEVPIFAGAAVTTENLIDALVYDNGQADDPGLAPLAGALGPINENAGGLGDTNSIQVCPSIEGPTRILLAPPTPGAPNACGGTIPPLVINELDCDQEGTDTGEFIELYDGGAGNTSLDGITLVFFNGSTDTAYAVFSLTGHATDANGYFLVGNAATNPDFLFANGALQNGPDAVALYAGVVGTGSPASAVNLIDAVVYGTGDEEDAGLLALVAPGESMADEGDASTAPFVSLQRCPNGEGVPFTLTPFRRSAPTPRAPSTCPADLPIAAFSVAPETIYGGDPVNFLDASAGGPLAYEWKFEGGFPATSSLQNPAGVTFGEPGSRRVTLTVSRGGSSDQAEVMINVLDPVPRADGIALQGIPAPCGSLVLGVDGLAGKPPLSVAWKVRDGQSAIVQETIGASTVWNLAADTPPGDYEATATIENASGPPAVISTLVSVADNRPNVEVSTTVPLVTNMDTIPLDIAIESQSVTSGIEVTDMQLENFTVESFSGNNDLYAVTLRFVAEGAASVAVAPGAAEVLCGVPTRASNLLELTLDQTAPEITLSSPTSSASPDPLFRVELATTEPVTGLEEQDFLLEGCTLTDLYAQGEGYVAFVFATAPGVISIQLRAKAVEDAARNTSEPSNVLQRAYILLPEGEQPYDHSADINQDGSITLDELLRVVQFFNSGSLHCEGETDDGYAPGPGSALCYPHRSDYLPEHWSISLSELLRLIQLYSLGAYRGCNTKISEDGYCVEL